MPEINSINIGGVSYSLGGGGSGDSAAIEDIKKLLFPSITTVGEEGTPVTFTKGDRVLTKIPDESGVVTEYLPELGTWTVETEIGGVELSRDVEVESNTDSFIETTLNKDIATSLGTAKAETSATTINEYALVGGGYYYSSGSQYSSQVDKYDKSLIKSYVGSLSDKRASAVAISTDNYAFFGGGYASTCIYTVETYNSSLVKGTINNLEEVERVTRTGLCGTSFNNYALFCGGGSGFYDYGYTNIIDRYNPSLVKETSLLLNNARERVSAASSKYYSLFAGGFAKNSSGNNLYYSTVEVFFSSFIKSSAPSLSIGRSDISNAVINDNIIFAGGYNNNTSSPQTKPNVDAYNSSLVKLTISNLSTGRQRMGATTIIDYALFCGGYVENSSNSSYGASLITEIYNKNLVKITGSSLSKARYDMSSTTVNGKGLFIGGRDYSSNYYNTVDVYNYDYVLSNKEMRINTSEFGTYLVPKASTVATTSDDIFIGSNSTSPSISTSYESRTSGFIPLISPLYIFIKKSLFNFSKYSETESVANALKYLNIVCHGVRTGSAYHVSFTPGSNHTTTHYQFVLTNAYTSNSYTPVRIYLQN